MRSIFQESQNKDGFRLTPHLTPQEEIPLKYKPNQWNSMTNYIVLNREL